MPWLCHQLGSREHYSIPRALHSLGQLSLLQTDCWVPPRLGRLIRATRQPSLADRFHSDLADARVRSFTAGRLTFDLQATCRNLTDWDCIMRRNQWFQKRSLPALRKELTEAPKKNQVVFAYSYAACSIFKEAKKQGALCVLGQMDPGPEEIHHVRECCGKVLESSPPPSHYWSKWREEVTLADRILANSEWSRELLITGGVPPEKIEVIPIAYETSTRSREKVARSYPPIFDASREMKVLYLGQIIPRKGINELFEAILNLEDIPIEFHIAGPIGMEIPAKVRAHSKTYFYGAVDRDTAARLYQNSDLFLLPTHSDGFAITQLEAAARNLPIISSKFCGRVVQDGKNGIVLPDVSCQSIKDALIRCVASPRLLAKMSAQCLDWNEFSLKNLGERLSRIGASMT